jgi:hypothetical protein
VPQPTTLPRAPCPTKIRKVGKKLFLIALVNLKVIVLEELFLCSLLQMVMLIFHLRWSIKMCPGSLRLEDSQPFVIKRAHSKIIMIFVSLISFFSTAGSIFVISFLTP